MGTSRQPGVIHIAGCSIVDTDDFIFGPHGFRAQNPLKSFFTPPWDGSPLRMDFHCQAPDAGRVLGFYEPEPWGVWSRTSVPAIVLPVAMQGHIQLTIDAAGFGCNAGKTIEIGLGNANAQVVLGHSQQTLTATLRVDAPSNLLVLNGLQPMAAGMTDDNRPLGMALRWVEILQHDVADTSSLCTTGTDNGIDQGTAHPDEGHSITLSGVTYLSIMESTSSDDNFIDILSAFCHAFRSHRDVTLIMCITRDDLGGFLGKFTQLLEQMQPFSCRVMTINGKTDESLLSRLASAAHYYVKVSHNDGHCMESMEMMAMGIPGISTPDMTDSTHTTHDSHYMVESTQSLTTPQTVMTGSPLTLNRLRTNWESLERCFRESHADLSVRPDIYKAKSLRCIEMADEYRTHQLSEESLTRLLNAHAHA